MIDYNFMGMMETEIGRYRKLEQLKRDMQEVVNNNNILSIGNVEFKYSYREGGKCLNKELAKRIINACDELMGVVEQDIKLIGSKVAVGDENIETDI